MEQRNETKVADDRARDAASLKILGMFFVVLSVLVMLGALWERNNIRAVIVSLTSGGLLLAIGLGMGAVGTKIAGRK